MLRWVIGALCVLALQLPVEADSFYPLKPDDARVVVLTKEAFPALQADGIADDSAVLQQAIDQASTAGSVLLVPSARYRITRTIGIPPSTRVIGFGKTCPTFLLAPHTPGFDGDGPKYMLWFTGGSRGRRQNSAPHDGSIGAGFSDANPGTFYSGLINVDIEIQEGNPAAVGIRAHFAQHGIIAHVDFRLGDGYAGMDEIGNEAEDLHFQGGQYGIITGGTSPSWQYTLLDSSFDGQRVAAFKTHNTGLTLIRDRFSNMPTAIAIDEGKDERLWMKDCAFTHITAPAILIGDEDNVRTQLNIEEIVCSDVPLFAKYLHSGKQVTVDGSAIYRVKRFSYGLAMDSDSSPSAIRQLWLTEPLSQLSPPVPTDIATLPPMETWANVRSFGAVGDGKTDDLPAFCAAIEKSKTIFLPRGQYRISDTVQLKPETVLVGLNPITTQITIDDAATSFANAPEMKAVLDAAPNGTNIVQGVGIDSGANNPHAVGVKWRAGEHSMINDVKFLGGHGTWYPDGHRDGPYNADHSADSHPERRWNSSGPSLWITDNGGGTFANIWTASTFSTAGAQIDHTTTPGHIYELSSEHHVRNEIIFDHVSNWQINAQQTEEEWGESADCLSLQIDGCTNLTFSNTILFRVFGMAKPFPTGIAVHNSTDLHFRGIRTYGQSPYNFDTSLTDTTSNTKVFAREIASIDLPGASAAAKPAHTDTLKQVGEGFYSADHAVTDAAGNAYFVDLHDNKILQFSPDTQKVTTLRSDPIKPFALAVDHSNNLLILSRLGKAYSLPLADPHAQLTEIAPIPAAPHPDMTAILPADRWWDSGHFLETNARREPLDILSPDHSLFVPVPDDFQTGQQHNWISQPIDLFRSTQLSPAPTGQTFYVADENEHKTWAFTPSEDGTLTNPRLFAQDGEAGIAVDAAGNVYIAEGNIFVYDAAGKQIDCIELPDRPLSLVFCGLDKKTLFITARHTAFIWQAVLNTPGDSKK